MATSQIVAAQYSHYLAFFIPLIDVYAGMFMYLQCVVDFFHRQTEDFMRYVLCVVIFSIPYIQAVWQGAQLCEPMD